MDVDPILPGSIPRTDPLGWRLLVSQDSHGQHKWVYLPPGDERRGTWPQTAVDKYWLGLETVSMPLSDRFRVLMYRGRARETCQRPRHRKRPLRMGSNSTNRFSPPTDTGQAHTAVRLFPIPNTLTSTCLLSCRPAVPHPGASDRHIRNGHHPPPGTKDRDDPVPTPQTKTRGWMGSVSPPFCHTCSAPG
jgi:hypothetical protein